MTKETEWGAQVQQMMQAWSDAQKKVWEGWVDTISGTGRPSGGSWAEWLSRWQETATKSLDAWRDLAQKALDAQSEWFSSDAFGSMGPGGSEATRRLAASYAEHSNAMLAAWTDHQRHLLDGWFGVAAAAQQEPGAEGVKKWYAQWEQAAKESFDSWQELLRRASDVQAKMAEGWKETAGGKSD